jgi:hypothetical protein
MKKFAVTIVSPPGYKHCAAFREVAESIHHGLSALGHDSVLTTEGRLPGRQHLVLGANLLTAYPLALGQDAILYNLEQVTPGSHWFRQQDIDLFRRCRMWDYSPKNVVALEALGVKVERVLPVGYAPELTRIRFTEPRDIDVLFFGSINLRRRLVINRMRAAGLKVHAVSGVYGQERDALIGRSKLLLNVHFYESKILEIVRVSYLLANRCAVLSETGADPYEEAALTGGVAFAPYEKLVEEACALVAAPARREALSRRGFDLMSGRLMSDYLRAALAGN